MSGLPGALPRLRRDQEGASTVEFALVLIPLLLLLFGIWDFGLGIWQHNALAEATRQAARFAVVRGEGATTLGEVGPAQEGPATCDGASLGPVTRVACAYGFPIVPSRLSVSVTWTGGDNRLGEPVVVEAVYQFQPILTSLFAVGTINLRSRSRMLVACCDA